MFVISSSLNPCRIFASLLSASRLSITTLSITTLGITTNKIIRTLKHNGGVVLLSVNYAECRKLVLYAECLMLDVIMLSSVILNVFMLSVVMLSVVAFLLGEAPNLALK